jgi:hypothetical protein
LAVDQVAAEGGSRANLFRRSALTGVWDAAAAATDHDRGGNRMAGGG